MFKNSNKVSDEKRKLVGFFILALIIIFSPYTITKLSTHGSDAASSETVMSGDGGYQKAEQELSDLSAQEKVLSESIQKADATNVVDPASSGAPDSRVDIQATQNKTTMSFYDFSDNQTEELKSDLVDQKVEGGIFYGTYDNSNNFQELSLNLTEANQLNLVVTDRSKSFLVYDLYLENADLVTDFHTELGNQVDQKELEWHQSSDAKFENGWNEVRLALAEGVPTGSIDWEKLNYFRTYFKLKETSKLGIKDIRIETETPIPPGIAAAIMPVTSKENIAVTPLANGDDKTIAADTNTQPAADQITLPAASNEQPLTANAQPAFDPATAPGKIVLQLRSDQSDNSIFPLKLRLIGVGRPPVIAESDKTGKIDIELSSGRYYAELVSDKYSFTADPPAFFIEASAERNLGAFSLRKR